MMARRSTMSWPNVTRARRSSFHHGRHRLRGETPATQRDRHLAMIDEHGRMAWRRRSGYNRRSLVETAMFRYKAIIGRKLQARTLSNQKTEAKIGCDVLNRMAGLGMPGSTRVH